jgi:hypothetical protein
MWRASLFVTVAFLAGLVIGFFARSALQRKAYRADLAAIERLHRHSFHPEPGFVERLVASIENTYQNEVNVLAAMGRQTARNFQMRSQMINEAMSTVRDLQWQTFNTQQQSQLKIAEGWMNTYAGTQDFIDPGTGQEYNFVTEWHNYRYSCMSTNEKGYFSNQLSCAELGGKLGISLHSISPVQ